MNNQDTTRQKILEVSAELFLTKGYEKTTLSDILSELGGLTKGAIYHYFDSKEDIFNTVVNELGNKNIEQFNRIKESTHMTGSEKLATIVSISFENDNMKMITDMSPSLLENPHLLSAFIAKISEITIPDYLEPIIYEGVKDGSIFTEYPKELASLLAIVLNIWLNPLILNDSHSTMNNKMELLNQLLETCSIKLFNDEISKKIY